MREEEGGKREEGGSEGGGRREEVREEGGGRREGSVGKIQLW